MRASTNRGTGGGCSPKPARVSIEVEPFVMHTRRPATSDAAWTGESLRTRNSCRAVKYSLLNATLFQRSQVIEMALIERSASPWAG